MNDLTELPETQLATPSENSRAWLSKQMENLTAMTSASDVLKQFARLAANYGDSRISTPEQRTLLLRAVRRRRARVDCGGTVRMETFQLAQIGVVFCCLVGLWVRGGREPIQGYIFTVAFIFNLLLTAVLGY